ncbi:Hypothetical_protein [Hexamita inflata]|uniref:Hypothetical_protein n=1 Tax=Hexamita inflata TaxID=28002 RepID=A0AA86TKW7_9EUKA|nr:Hypothetical protein HINF_LOCUS7981 [Hexamita inflata]
MKNNHRNPQGSSVRKSIYILVFSIFQSYFCIEKQKTSRRKLRLYWSPFFSDHHISFPIQTNDHQETNNIPLQQKVSHGVITRHTSSQTLRQLFRANGVCFGDLFVDNRFWLSRELRVIMLLLRYLMRYYHQYITIKTQSTTCLQETKTEEDRRSVIILFQLQDLFFFNYYPSSYYHSMVATIQLENIRSDTTLKKKKSHHFNIGQFQ